MSDAVRRQPGDGDVKHPQFHHATNRKIQKMSAVNSPQRQFDKGRAPKKEGKDEKEKKPEGKEKAEEKKKAEPETEK